MPTLPNSMRREEPLPGSHWCNDGGPCLRVAQAAPLRLRVRAVLAPHVPELVDRRESVSLCGVNEKMKRLIVSPLWAQWIDWMLQEKSWNRMSCWKMRRDLSTSGLGEHESVDEICMTARSGRLFPKRSSIRTMVGFCNVTEILGTMYVYRNRHDPKYWVQCTYTGIGTIRRQSAHSVVLWMDALIRWPKVPCAVVVPSWI